MMADGVLVTPGTSGDPFISTDETALINGSAVTPQHIQRMRLAYGPLDAPLDVTAAQPLPVVEASAAAILAKITSDPATQTTLAAVLAKITSDPATQTTLAAILAKLTSDPSTATLQTSANTKLDTLHTDLGTTLAGYLDGVEGLLGRLPSGGASTEASLAALVTANHTDLLAVIAKDEAIRALLAGTLLVDSSTLATAAKQPTLVSGRTPVDPSGVTSPVSAASLPLPTGAAKDSTLTDGTQRVGGTVAVSAASLPLPTGAAKDSTLTDGTQRVGGTVTVDTELPAAAALADAVANPTVPGVGGFGMVWNGTTWDRAPGSTALGQTVNTELPAAAALSDSDSNPTAPTVGSAGMVWDSSASAWVRAGNAKAATDAMDGAGAQRFHPMLYNGATFDRQRGNQGVTLLASAARTGTTTTATQTNYNARGIVVFLNVTVASGTGGLQVQLGYVDPVSGNNILISTAPTAITATGIRAYIYFPGNATGGLVSQNNQTVLPRSFYVSVAHGDGSSYTYSVGGSVIL